MTYNLFFLSGADPRLKTSGDETLLHAAAKGGHLPVVQFLIETLKFEEGYIHEKTNDHSSACLRKIKTPTEMWTALHFACGLGHRDVVVYLLEHGAETGARTGDGLRPVEVCKAFRHKELVPIFEERRASQSKVDNNKKTSRSQARRQTVPANSGSGPDWVYF